MTDSSEDDVAEEKAHFDWVMMRTDVQDQAAALAGVANALQWLTVLGAVVGIVLVASSGTYANGGSPGIGVVLIVIVAALVQWAFFAALRLFARYVAFKVDPRT